jgi:hypothetical protein
MVHFVATCSRTFTDAFNDQELFRVAAVSEIAYLSHSGGTGG